MTTFKISTNRLPVKWQAELRDSLGGDATAPAPVAADKKTDAGEIVVTAAGPQIVDDLLKWIQRMNRQQKSNKISAKTSTQSFPGQGISLTLERADGSRITLTERNASVVKQFLSS